MNRTRLRCTVIVMSVATTGCDAFVAFDGFVLTESSLARSKVEVVDPLPDAVATPISHARIELWNSRGTRKHFEVFSEDDGRFHADRIVGGPVLLQPWFYRLRVARDGFDPLDCTIRFRYRGNRFVIRLKPLN